jgi:hypothetical protein
MYTNLKIVINSGNANGLTNTYFTVNSDSGSNYSWTRMYGTGSTAGSGRGTNTSSLFLGDNPTNISGIDAVYLMNYSNTNMYKTILVRSSLATSAVQAAVGTWRNTSAITSITFTASGNSFLAGSTFDVYGVGSGINGAGGDATSKASGGEVFSDSTYYYHVFKGSGTFAPTTSLTADILVVAGGGGSSGNWGGGGGAGGFLSFTSQSLVSGTAYTCTVGAGGAGAQYTPTNGGSSIFGALTTAVGGGSGGSASTGGGGTGGSGGGGTYDTSAGNGTAGQGNSGGSGQLGGGGNARGGGGGGAGASGGTANGTIAGVGGIGVYSTLTDAIGAATGFGDYEASHYYFAGGGGGGGGNGTTENSNVGGYGGGGNGNRTAPNPGQSNTGGGGGGGGGNALPVGGNGGSGIVIVRYAK